MIDIGVASPSARGHAMIKHRDRVDQAVSTNLSDLITGSRVVAAVARLLKVSGRPVPWPLANPELAIGRLRERRQAVPRPAPHRRDRVGSEG